MKHYNFRYSLPCTCYSSGSSAKLPLPQGRNVQKQRRARDSSSQCLPQSNLFSALIRTVCIRINNLDMRAVRLPTAMKALAESTVRPEEVACFEEYPIKTDVKMMVVSHPKRAVHTAIRVPFKRLNCPFSHGYNLYDLPCPRDALISSGDSLIWGHIPRGFQPITSKC